MVRKVRSGQRFKPLGAADHNAIAEAAEHYQRFARMGTGDQSSPPPLLFDRCKVKNTSGAALARGSVLEITGDLLTDIEAEHPWFTGDTPSGTSVPFCVTRRAAADDEIVEALAMGFVIARVNVTSTSHTHAALTASQTYLTSGTSDGARILNTLTATGVQECWILLGAGSGSSCPAQNDIQDITVFGVPTGGTFTWTLTVGVTTTGITLDYNDTAAAVQSAIIAGHSQVSSGDVSCSGGPFPTSTVRVEFQGNLANQEIALATANFAALTGGSGVAVLCSKAQLGSAG